jgi:hypothetical protein
MDLRVSYLSTLRPDGAPRVNAVTPWFIAGRLLFIRMNPGSVKVRGGGNQERPNPYRYVVPEFDVDDAMSTVYEGDGTVRRRWPT